MRQFEHHPGALLLLMNRLAPPDQCERSVIELRSRAEYDAIPEHWSFRCFGALYRLTAKRWFPGAGKGEATFTVW